MSTHASLPHPARAALMLLLTLGVACIPTPPGGPARDPRLDVPESFGGVGDSRSSGLIEWREFFEDEHLVALIETALENNQELNIAVQEILVANAEVMARRGEYLPRLGFGIDAGVEHVGRYTSQGQNDEMAGVAATLQEYRLGLYSSWEIDVWGRLRNLASAAAHRYLASVEGRNFMVTRLVAEIASLYYELLALDRRLEVLDTNIALQEHGLRLVRAQFEGGRVTILAVTRFEATLRAMQSARYLVQQRIVETENRINFLAGRYPLPVARSSDAFLDRAPPEMSVGVPSDLLSNRPDVRQAELQLAAARLDVSAARAAFYPSLGIEGVVGYESYDARRLFNTPDSLLFGLLGRIFAPLLNRKGLTAEYFASNSREMQAVLNYERAVLAAVIEVSNRVSLMHNLRESLGLKQQQVQLLSQAIDASTSLFNSGRAEYLDVLTTRQELLEAQLELIELKRDQMIASVTLYQALGGGWRTPATADTEDAAADESQPATTNEITP